MVGVAVNMKATEPKFLVVKLKSFRKCYIRHRDLVNFYKMSASQMTMDMFCLS